MLHAHRFFVVSDFSKKSSREAACILVSKSHHHWTRSVCPVKCARSNPASFGCSVFMDDLHNVLDHPRFLALPRRMALVAVPSVCASI
jgi:hypothetical protein